MHRIALAAVILTLALLGYRAAAVALAPGDMPSIVANDNRLPAGTLKGGVLTVSLESRMGLWYPDGRSGIDLPVEAFAEPGRDLRVPGPLVRVPQGTVVVATVRNSVPGTTLAVHGLTDRPARGDHAIVLRYGEARTVRFTAGAPGTYYYWGSTTGKDVTGRIGIDAFLSGALVVDDPHDRWPRTNDRVLVVNEWSDVLKKGNVDFKYALYLFNGREFPQTERMTYPQGTRVRWRIVNASWEDHPLHLHGFYYTIDARGDALRDVIYPAAEKHDVRVTELLASGTTETMSWTADRPGNWLFHCHFPYHAMTHGAFSQVGNKRYTAAVLEQSATMGGLMMVVTVTPKSAKPSLAVRPPARTLNLVIQPAAGDTPAMRAFEYVLQENGVTTTGTGSLGPPLILTRGQTVGITVVNHLDQPTTVHWHGIELEDSFYDGAAGIAGYGARREPMIMPGETFAARFTPPRAGTFIYHTHMSDIVQGRAGLSGPLIVLPPGAKYDPATDHIVQVTVPRDRTQANGLNVNGLAQPAAMTLAAGLAQRFRFINMTSLDSSLLVSLVSAGAPATWTPLAVDGADLPAALRRPERAVRTVTIGQTRDFIFMPPAPGEYRLLFWDYPGDELRATLPLHVVVSGPVSLQR